MPRSSFVDWRRQRDREQKTDRFGALGGEIGQIHPQYFAGDQAGRIVGEEMHAGDDAVGGQHQIAPRRRRQDRGVIGKTERAGRSCERTEIFCDQVVFSRALIGARHDYWPANSAARRSRAS
jgi:hypothetical protein